MKVREQRFPSSWAFELRTREARFRLRVTNVSLSGLRFEGRLAARVGQTVKFKVLGEVVTGKIARITPENGAVAFRKKLETNQLWAMRQCRAEWDI